MRYKTERNIEEVQRRYDPENDTPVGPAVTWADDHIADAVSDLLEYVYSLEKRIEKLEEQIMRWGGNDAEYHKQWTR